MGVRGALNRATWRERGFELSDQEISAVERFFEAWFPIYQLPGTTAYRSQDALFGVHRGCIRIFGEGLSKRDQRNAVSVLRAGYCVAATERVLNLRVAADPNLSELFRLMEERDARPHEEPFARALRRGEQISETAWRMAIEEPDIAAGLPGTPLRDAILADLRGTLFVKLKLVNLPARLDSDVAEAAMRFAHALGVCEEALPAAEPLARF
jgi:hypothetical protein